ncbi:MAG: IS200/IS605 family transposase [Gammaproteobacteria bacterium]|nr:IS200/IS605 family transposase [Gammaproteobacteria bacterium]
MPQSLTRIWLHIIFSTKNREPLLTDKEVRKQVHAYLAGICKQMSSSALIIGGIADHVHILCNQSKNVALKDLIQKVKQGSSKWVKRQWPSLNYFYWQQGYGAFSVCPPHVDKVRDYIANQEEHHRKVGFQDEFRSFLERYQVPYDERYVWD